MEVPAGWFVGSIMERVIKAGFDYLSDQVGWQTGMREELERLQDSLPKIQAVVSFASSQIESSDQLHLNKWLWQLGYAIDEADDVLDEFENMKHEIQLITENNKKKEVPSNIVSSMKERFVNLIKRLEEVVNKLDKVSAGVGDFLYLLKNTNQEQQLELYKSRETGGPLMPKNNIIGRDNDKEFVMQGQQLEFVGPIVERLVNAGFDYLKDQVGWETHVKAELERLQVILPNIQAVAAFASSQTEISNQLHLNKWLWKLRDAIDEADDVLDDFEYIKHEQQLTTKNNKRKKVPSIFFSYMKKSLLSSHRALEIDPNLKRLEEVVNKLDKVSARVDKFIYLLQNTKQQQQLELYKSRATGPLPQNDIIGRGNDREFVMQWLMSEPSNEEDQNTRYKNISLLSIVGHGGMGKTTLLQHVYEDVKTEEFPLKVWVCVSTNFDAKKVIADMLECLTKERPRLEALGPLQESLKSKVNSKKFLLVLDDIWEEENEERNKSKWADVIAPLVSGCLGSKILITTRMESVALMMTKVIGKKSETLEVEGLEEEECLQLLNAHAFAGVENPDDHKKLRFITGKMVKKLSRSPLAAKIMGGVLNSCLEERHWNKVLNSEIGNIMPILRLSYTFLPKPLQSCFTFCCIFPQDHEFDKDDLVRMWIALGFIQPPNIREETMEDIGGRYFDALVKKSFFDKFFDNHYKMHDLLHELAQFVSKHECLRVASDQELSSKTSETIRHLFVETRNQEELKKIQKFKNLRSLLINYEGDENVDVDVITEIFNATRSIRLLYIHGRNLKMIFQAVGYLTHLRYLKVSNSSLSKWITSLCNLYHLQFIIWDNDYTDCIFLEDMNNLSNLRYWKHTFYKFPHIPEIGKLSSLQEFDNFEVKNESGYRIEELEQMNDLRKLNIHSLDNVTDAQGACNAKLRDKRNLTKLSLKWDHFRDPIDIDLNDEKVLDNLQPPSCLQKLKIDKYMGVRSAKWMNTADFISNLEIIKLSSCSNWRTLPPFGQLRFLKSLHLDSMPKVKQFDNKFHGNDERCVFPSLEKLHFSDLEALEDWFDAKEVAARDMFPCLTELHLSNCPNLQELPYLPPKLNKLFIYNIGWETLNCCSISKLEELKVSCCPNITNISLARLAASRLLEIKNCPKLISLGGHTEVETTENYQLILSSLGINDPSILLMEPLRSVTSVQKLVIENNDELVSFPFEAEGWFLQVSSSLLKLKFASLQSLQSLPSFLESLSSIKTLSVKSIPQLRELPNLPPTLVRLSIRDVPQLRELPNLPPSLDKLSISGVPQLRELPNLPPSLDKLHLAALNNLDCLPSCLPILSSLKLLSIENVPQLRELPNLPPSLAYLRVTNLDNLDCLPSCLPILSSLKLLSIENVPQLRELPNLPPSLAYLRLTNLDNLDCLPSCLPILSSLKLLSIENVPQLRELPNLPPSLGKLSISGVPQLQELPNLPPSLDFLSIMDLPQLRNLPDLPSSLEYLYIDACHPKLMKRYPRAEPRYRKGGQLPLLKSGLLPNREGQNPPSQIFTRPSPFARTQHSNPIFANSKRRRSPDERSVAPYPTRQRGQ